VYFVRGCPDERPCDVPGGAAVRSDAFAVRVAP
jgi:hypothetical protein